MFLSIEHNYSCVSAISTSFNAGKKTGEFCSLSEFFDISRKLILCYMRKIATVLCPLKYPIKAGYTRKLILLLVNNEKPYDVKFSYYSSKISRQRILGN